MKIIVDGYGGDNAPLEIIKGASLAVEELDIDIILTGDVTEIKKIATENNISLNRIELVNTTEVIDMEDDAMAVIKDKKNSSMAVGLNMLAKNEGDAFVSAGNSGALTVGATMIAKRIKGIKRAAFAPIIPTANGFAMLLDSGANADCRAEMLLQFGVMGSIYMDKVMNVKNPRVGLANIGTEPTKGTQLQLDAYELLEKSNLNFIGNVEGRDIPINGCDVLVADGFTGNLIVKTYEGVALALMGKIKDMFSKNLKTKLAAALIMNDLKEMKKQFDYNEYGGSAILGISKPVFKCHGSAKAKTLKSAISLAKQYVDGNVTQEIENSLKNKEVI